MRVKAMPLEEVLKTAFRSTDFLASIDGDNQVFLTKGTSIVTTLPTPGNVRRKDSLMYAKLFAVLIQKVQTNLSLMKKCTR
jgi:hypothetical protein